MKEKTRRVIADMTEEIDRLKRVISARDKWLAEGRERHRATEDNLLAMAARVDELAEQNRNLNAEFDECDKSRKALERLVAEIEEEKAFLVNKNRNLTARANESENVELRQAVDRLTTENERLSQRLDEEIKEVNRLSFAISTLTEESETLTGLVGRLRDAIFAAAAGLDVPTVEEGDPSLLEIVAALGHAAQEGWETNRELDEAFKVLALVLFRLDQYGYGAPHIFSVEEIAQARAALKGKDIIAETSNVDGRVAVALESDGAAS